MSCKAKVGFLGLGAMGLGMASHLAKEGFDIVGYDLNPQASSRLESEGGFSALSPREAASGRDLLVVVVATSDQASTALLDPKAGCVGSLPNGSTILMCITAAPEYMLHLKEHLTRLGRSDVNLIDCPISGGEVRAWQGNLSLICSGDQTIIDKAHDLLKCMSSQLHLIPGGIGRASSVKMVHQILVGVHILATVEVMGLCAVAGLNPQEVYDGVEKSDSYSWLFGQRAAHMIDMSKVPASSLMIITKDFVSVCGRDTFKIFQADLKHAMLNASARRNMFPLPLASTAFQLFLQACAAGHSNDDCKTLEIYLSGRGSLETFPTVSAESLKTNKVTADTIHDILVGVHSVVAIEALAYAQSLGVSASVLKAVVKDAAGSSVMFGKIASQFPDDGDVSLRHMQDFDAILRPLSSGVEAAASLGYPAFLATAALQQFHLEKSIAGRY